MPLRIPEVLQRVPYNGLRHPGAPTTGRPGRYNAAEGANCQLFAYALLEFYGLEAPPWRSSDLWTDTQLSRRVTVLGPLDLLLWNRTPEAWGAHVGVYLGEGYAAHLSKADGMPLV